MVERFPSLMDSSIKTKLLRESSRTNLVDNLKWVFSEGGKPLRRTSSLISGFFKKHEEEKNGPAEGGTTSKSPSERLRKTLFEGQKGKKKRVIADGNNPRKAFRPLKATLTGGLDGGQGETGTPI